MNLVNDTLSLLKVADAPMYKSPKSLQQAIEIKNVYCDGIFELPNGKYSKCWIFDDVNYAMADEEEQTALFVKYCKLLNSLDACYKITINNKRKDMKKLESDVMLKNSPDGLDQYRNDMNKIIKDKIVIGRQGIEQERYLTVTVERRNIYDARAFFSNLELHLKKAFREMGTGIAALDGAERLHILYDFYHLGRENAYEVNFDTDMMKQYDPDGNTSGTPLKDFRNDLCNGFLKFTPDFFQDETKYCTALFIKQYPHNISDGFINKIMSLPAHIITSIDVVPIPKDITTKQLKKKYIGIENDILKQQKSRNKNLDFSGGISYTKRIEKEDIEEIMDDIRENDKCLFFVGVTMLVSAKDKNELDSICATIQTIAKDGPWGIERHYLMQREALNTALPIGIRQVETMRTLLTDRLAALMPFNVQELCETKGQFYGTNQVSRNLCVGDRKSLINGNGFVFGVPGSGKSFFCKMEMLNVLLGTDDDVIVVDPMNEYVDFARALNGAVIEFSNNTENHINPMDVILDDLDLNDKKGVIREKGEFMLGVCEQCLGAPLNAREKSIIDRCVRELYMKLATQKAKGKEDIVMPTMSSFFWLLEAQPEPEAANLAVALELFIKGSLNIFNNQTNVDVNNRFTVYGIKDLGKELAPLSMLIMMERISRRINENAAKGKATWLYIDEMHVLLNSQYTMEYFFELWKKVRKQGGLCTGITQNVLDLIGNYTVMTMLANSEFIVLLKQSQADAGKLSETLGISNAHIGFVTDSAKGTGLMNHGSVIVPFDAGVDKDTLVYQMFNTNPHEK